jgi:AcrR family transcriptional regulator
VRAQVLQATIDLLVAHGYGGLRFEDVAAGADVHRATVYRHWPSRSDLVMDAVREFTAHAIPMPDTGNIHDDFVEIVLSLGTMITSTVGKAIMGAVHAGDAESGSVTGLGREIWRQRLQLARPIIGRAVERGELPECDPELLYETLCGPVHLRALHNDRALTPLEARWLVDLVIAGLWSTEAGGPATAPLAEPTTS